jgi:hypothetical protein
VATCCNRTAGKEGWSIASEERAVVREKPPKREPPTTQRSERMPSGEVGRRRTGGQGKDEAFVCSSDLGSARLGERIDDHFFFPFVLERGVGETGTLRRGAREHD